MVLCTRWHRSDLWQKLSRGKTPPGPTHLARRGRGLCGSTCSIINLSVMSPEFKSISSKEGAVLISITCFDSGASAQMPSWSFSSMTGGKDSGLESAGWWLWCCCWSWGWAPGSELWAISQGTPPPIKGMARAPLNQPTTNNNTETSKHGQIWHIFSFMKVGDMFWALNLPYQFDPSKNTQPIIFQSLSQTLIINNIKINF